ncbi:hypothetical protein HZH68_015706 [Vespula germanica]|uniref:Reverse transcriptase domain-containing protein n=1 Tax=Vespula germanica TaxID=30212 RepID=A0A834J5B3_VESGE|nr:hypothetical protein HZH68_015706 [Vespula germanica]
MQKIEMAFSTPYDSYEFIRMPFGLKNAPSTFQKLMKSILSRLHELNNLDELFVYLDDILDKYSLLRKEVAYLAHIISATGVKPDSGKIRALKEFPTPHSIKNIKQFLGIQSLVTDHKSLIWLNSIKDLTAKLMQWCLKLTEYEYKIVYKTDKRNVNADALFKNPTRASKYSDSRSEFKCMFQEAYCVLYNNYWNISVDNGAKELADNDKLLRLTDVTLGKVKVTKKMKGTS